MRNDIKFGDFVKHNFSQQIGNVLEKKDIVSGIDGKVNTLCVVALPRDGSFYTMEWNESSVCIVQKNHFHYL